MARKGKWYIRCYDDNGRKIGSNESKEGKIFLNAQSWAMIAGIADKERTEKLVHSANELLKTEIGYRLLAPTYTTPDPNVGRISFMEPGICENGTVHSHVNIWMILGLLRAGRVEEDYEAFCLHSPDCLCEDGSNDAGNEAKMKMLPIFMPMDVMRPTTKSTDCR